MSKLGHDGYVFGSRGGVSDGLYASKALRRRCEEEFPPKAMVEVFLFDTNILVHAYSAVFGMVSLNRLSHVVVQFHIGASSRLGW